MRIGAFVEEENHRPPADGHHLCGVLVMAKTGRAKAVGRVLAAMAGVEVHRVEPDGRLIVTVEDTAEERAGQILTRLPNIEGVLAASLVYHHCE